MKKYDCTKTEDFFEVFHDVCSGRRCENCPIRELENCACDKIQADEMYHENVKETIETLQEYVDKHLLKGCVSQTNLHEDSRCEIFVINDCIIRVSNIEYVEFKREVGGTVLYIYSKDEKMAFEAGREKFNELIKIMGGKADENN